MKNVNAGEVRKTERELTTDSFVISEVKTTPNARLPRHVHDVMNLVCVLDGAFFQRFRSKEFMCVPKTVLFEPPGDTHSNRYMDSGAHCIMVSVRPDQVKKMDKLASVFEEVRLIEANGDFTLIKQLYREICRQDELTELAVEGISLELIANSSRKGFLGLESDSTRPVYEARDYIQANFSRKLSLSVVANEVGVHPSHLARTFRNTFRASIGDYIRRLRLEFAIEQLVDTSAPLSEISAASGFYDQSHFTNMFKKHYRVTPTQYRKLKSG